MPISEEKPLVSILIPVFNREYLVAEAIESACGQDYGNLEIIVSDNGSTDGTWDTVQRWAARDPRVNALRSPENLGPVLNWKRAAESARGQYACILWSDDLLHPSFVSTCVRQLAAADIGFTLCGSRKFCTASDVHLTPPPTASSTRTVATNEYIEGLIIGEGYSVSPSTGMFHTKDLLDCIWTSIPNSINSDFSQHGIGSDLMLLLLIAKRHSKLQIIEDTLCFFRHHGESITVQTSFSRLQTYYDIVKASFVRLTGMKELEGKLNAELLLHHRKYRATDFGVSDLGAYYPDGRFGHIKFSHFFTLAAKFLRRRLRLNSKTFGASSLQALS